jgi:hypothetical protein
MRNAALALSQIGPATIDLGRHSVIGSRRFDGIAGSKAHLLLVLPDERNKIGWHPPAQPEDSRLRMSERPRHPEAHEYRSSIPIERVAKPLTPGTWRIS